MIFNREKTEKKPMNEAYVGELKRANDRLSRAASRLKDANVDLDLAEKEHRIASELVDHWEKVTSNPEAK